MAAQIISIMAPVLLISLVGYGWDRYRLPFNSEMVTLLVTNVAAPCLVVSALMASRPDPIIMAKMATAAAMVVSMSGVIGFLVLRVLRLPLRVYLPALIFPNAGNMGIPLCLFTFGEIGLSLGVAFFATVALLQFTIGLAVASGKFALRFFLRNPLLWAFCICIFLLLTGLTLPIWLFNTVDLLGGLAIPLLLLSLGMSLSRLWGKPIGQSFILAAFRLGIGFAVGCLVAQVLGLEGPLRGAVIILSTMPAAIINYMFAIRYENRPTEVAGVVVVSTMLSFVTLPFLLAFVLGY